MAFDRLTTDSPAGLILLSIAARFAPEPIQLSVFTTHAEQLPGPLAATAAEPLAMAELCRQLRRRALARIDADGLQLHGLVQTLLTTRAIQPGLPDPGRIAIRLLCASVPANTTGLDHDQL
jgi:hypothetical protein